GAAAQQHRIAALDVALADEGGVRDAGILARQRVLVAVRIGLGTDGVAVRRVAMDRDDELDGAAISEVGIEAVIVGAGLNEILEVLAAAEEFQTVVRA